MIRSWPGNKLEYQCGPCERKSRSKTALQIPFAGAFRMSGDKMAVWIPLALDR
jgi:hypothetical protein